MRVRGEGLRGATDTAILAWAAERQRVLLTQDAQTVPGHAHDRIAAGESCPGVLVAVKSARSREIIDDVVLLLRVATPDDVRDRVLYLPLR